MAVLTKYPASVQAAGGVFNGAWTGAVSTVQSDNAVYATAAPGKNQEFASVFSVPFSTAEVPDGSTINSVLVECQWKVSTAGSIATLRSTAFADSAQSVAVSTSPGVNDTAEPLADTTRSYAATPTLDQLRGLWIRVQALRGKTNTAFTASLDFVRVTVDYTLPSADRSASITWAELEAPNAPRAATVTWAEVETGNAPRTATITWAELETPDAPISLDRSASLTWAEIEVPTAPRSAVLTWAEMESGTPPRSAQVTWAAVEVPSLSAAGPRHGLMTMMGVGG